MEDNRRRSIRNWVCLALLLLGAFLLRLAAAIWWQRQLVGPLEFFFPDSHSYWHLALAIAFAQPYQFGSADAQVFRMPGYPMVLAPVFWLGGAEVPVLWARLWGALLGVVPVGCCWWLGRRLFGLAGGWWAGIIAAVYPEAVAASVWILSEAAFCPVMCLQLVVLILAWQSRQTRHRLGYVFGAGLLGGVGTLVRPSWLWFTPLAALWGIVACSKQTGQRESTSQRLPGSPISEQLSSDGSGAGLWNRLMMAGLMLAGMTLPLIPWWIRNYRLIGRWVPTTLQVGASLYDGLRPGATGKSQMEFLEEFARSEWWLLQYRGPAVRMLAPERWRVGQNFLKPAASSPPPTPSAVPLSAEPKPLPETPPPTGPEPPDGASQPVLWEYWLDRALAEEALRWASRHPGQVLGLACKKLWRMWSPWPNEPTLAASPLAAVVGGTYLPILLAGFLALGQAARRGKQEVVLLALPALYLSLVHLVFVSSVRYRGPAMLGWIVLAAGWAAEKLSVLRHLPNSSK